MKRMLLILIIMLLPVQAGLAAACAYCIHPISAHEDTTPSAEVQRVMAQDNEAGDDRKTANPSHCTLCHHAVVTLPAFTPPSLATNIMFDLPQHFVPRYDPSHLDRIERVPLHAAALI